MVGQNYLEVKKFFISVILILISIKVSFAENFNFKKKEELTEFDTENKFNYLDKIKNRNSNVL